MALYVSAFVFFAVASGVRNADASCGDYLKHARNGAFSDAKMNSTENSTENSHSVPACNGGNCRSAPTLPPIEPARIVLPQRQPADFQVLDGSFSLQKSPNFEFADDDLPSSVTLEVSTPPPILVV